MKKAVMITALIVGLISVGNSEGGRIRDRLHKIFHRNTTRVVSHSVTFTQVAPVQAAPKAAPKTESKKKTPISMTMQAISTGVRVQGCTCQLGGGCLCGGPGVCACGR